ncbi:hypothetical protein GXW83_31455 [Streptacidiphilus sp. PB12-B1b]|uniref:hypothetical protein n=1 Tax=Streptacidiphilus sp. PB12-B1b TaxID=2705012 RepID=UPI0015FD6515|nr:hypothetical protein [Streptacidiphilus sp. PB12-B1b]QMU79550.1 hypothetical protein GXW83_31455 [Streptacidiphilus sp. PB12-B1b]
MPTPHGSRGGMAFSADELRVLRRALAHMLNPATPAAPSLPGWARSAWVEDVQDVLRLAESIDDAVHEAGRMRAFALADLARYRSALPGTASGYLERLEEAVSDGYLPDDQDLAALRNLTALPCAPSERVRRLGLRSRCGALAQAATRRALESGPQRPVAAAALTPGPGSGPAVPEHAGVPAARPATDPAARPATDPAAGQAAEPGAGHGSVADFARASRSLRQRDKSRPAAPATGGHPHPLPTRRGGAIPMAAFDPAAQSDEPGQGSVPAPAHGAVAPVRSIPTPGDLWPRGVRAGADAAAEEEAELATGTG